MTDQRQAAPAYEPPFQALVFDVGGVILAHDNALMFDRLASACRQPCTGDGVAAVLRRREWNAGAPVAELHRELQDALGYGRGWDDFVAAWCCHFTVDASMMDFLRQLETRNRVMLFSNTNQEHWDHLLANEDATIGDFEAYLSHEIRLAKPSVESFARVAELAGIDPARSIFFDDVAANVDGARRAGFQAEVFTTEAALRRLLAEHGVRWG